MHSLDLFQLRTFDDDSSWLNNNYLGRQCYLRKWRSTYLSHRSDFNFNQIHPTFRLISIWKFRFIFIPISFFDLRWDAKWMTTMTKKRNSREWKTMTLTPCSQRVMKTNEYRRKKRLRGNRDLSYSFIFSCWSRVVDRVGRVGVKVKFLCDINSRWNGEWGTEGLIQIEVFW